MNSSCDSFSFPAIQAKSRGIGSTFKIHAEPLTSSHAYTGNAEARIILTWIIVCSSPSLTPAKVSSKEQLEWYFKNVSQIKTLGTPNPQTASRFGSHYSGLTPYFPAFLHPTSSLTSPAATLPLLLQTQGPSFNWLLSWPGQTCSAIGLCTVQSLCLENISPKFPCDLTSCLFYIFAEVHLSEVFPDFTSQNCVPVFLAFPISLASRFSHLFIYRTRPPAIM